MTSHPNHQPDFSSTPPQVIKQTMKPLWRYIATFAVGATLCTGCMKYGPLDEVTFDSPHRGVFITCEGNFRWDNASLSFYNPASKGLENEVFLRANGMKLGDVAQSMAIRGKRGYVVVNYSGRIYVINTDSFEVTGVIEDLLSPRFLHFVNDTTAYVTDLYDPQITVIDTRTNRIRNRISTNGHKSTEQMVQLGDELFTNCWSYDDQILVIDTRRERVVDSIAVGPQPSSLVLDRNGKLWTITDGRTEGVRAALYRIDAATRRIEQTYEFAAGEHPSSVTLNGARDTLYFINRDVWRMPVSAVSLPTTPFLPYTQTIYYSVGVDPTNSDVYVGDAIDYRQHGVVYRFTSLGVAADTLRVGITPGSFCFKP